MIKETDLAWLAGFVDGEGYLGLRIIPDHRKNKNGKKKNPQIIPEFGLVNCDEDMIDKANNIIKKIGLLLKKRQYKQKGFKRNVFELRTKGNRRIQLLLSKIVSYLTGSKFTRADLILKFCDLRINAKTYKNPFGSGRIKPYSSEELEIWEKCQPLMRRGIQKRKKNLQILKNNASFLSKLEKSGQFTGETRTVWKCLDDIILEHPSGIKKEKIFELLEKQNIKTKPWTITQYLVRNENCKFDKIKKMWYYRKGN